MDAKAHALRYWIIRRLEKGIQPTADEVWEQVTKRFPKASEEEREAVFQKMP